MSELNVYKNKDEAIKIEKRRLRGIFKNLDKNMLKTVDKLIDRAAFMAVSLRELEEIINIEGYTCEYKNGENQSGTKRSPEVDIHLSMTKNYTAVIKQLSEITPPAPKKGSKLDALRRSG